MRKFTNIPPFLLEITFSKDIYNLFFRILLFSTFLQKKILNAFEFTDFKIYFVKKKEYLSLFMDNISLSSKLLMKGGIQNWPKFPNFQLWSSFIIYFTLLFAFSRN